VPVDPVTPAPGTTSAAPSTAPTSAAPSPTCLLFLPVIGCVEL
jgi:hypothetical protein